MRVLVTGGAGFIGSHLAETLLQNGHQVRVVDNLSTGSLENIRSFKDHPAFTFTEGDICNAELMSKMTEQSDAVYHLAAAVGVKLIADTPVRTIETNITGTTVVLEAANKLGKKVFIASSSEVYGKNEAVPFAEEDDIVLGSTTLSRWSYACSKAIDEFLGLAFHQQYNLEVIIGRFFNTVGPRQTGRYGMVVPRFVQSALKNEPIDIYGTGRQKRCFCYVGDVVDAIISLVNCRQAVGKVYNIGSTEEISINGLADKIIKMTGSKSKKQYVPYETAYGRPIEDMMRRVPNIERIKNMVGWQPRTSLAEMLGIVIDAFRSDQL
ncbi:MAG TPA: SDR family NAD(P)-dependent oxidoreductase [Sedimentisphaerales bacterium]|nr:SDR family NAD(P)-dependent oxidoreductase [Sedimentisphaerales bacterium]